MRVPAWSVATALCLSAFAFGCAEDKETATPPPPAAPQVILSASAPSAIANGTSTVTLNVTDTGGASVSLSTTAGTFQPSGLTTAVFSSGSGSVVLRTCSGCSVDAVVTATSVNGSDTETVRFIPVATACLTNCSIDTGCAGLACTLTGGGAGTCTSTPGSTCQAAPACTPTSGFEASCGGGVDEDCDGDVDCADDDCSGRSCPGGATFFCSEERCTDISSGLAVVVTPTRTRLPANGTTTAVVEVEVTHDAEPVSSIAVQLSTSFGQILAPATASTGADGKARFTFAQTSAAAGVATLTAQLAAVPGVSGTGRITLPKLGALLIVTEDPGSVQYPVMGAKGSGWREYGFIQVQAIDDLGLPYPDDLAVRFEHRSHGGSTLDPLVATTTVGCTTGTPCSVDLSAVWSGEDDPDTTGLANAWVYSGIQAGTLAFTATATAGGVTRTISLPTATVVGAKASGSNFSVLCSPVNVPALADTTCSVSRVDAPFSCVALLKDRFGNVLGRETQVSFQSEAAAGGQPVWTPAYDGGAGPQLQLGSAVQGFTTLGAGLPFDVAPIAGEPSVSHGLDGCGTRTHNPRDGVVTIVAIADGEEAFWDSNGNGVYDSLPAASAEPFIDQGEPFVDENDNGQWDPGEWFDDVDQSTSYTARNGVWDANTKIWTQTVVVYTGDPETVTTGANYLGTRFAAAGSGACTPTPQPASFDVDAATSSTPATSEGFAVFASDLNLNFLHEGTQYGVSMWPESVSIEIEYDGLETYADTLGFFYQYWPCASGGAGACASQCRATGAAAPCVMKPSITSFSCGLDGFVLITGGDEPESGTARWNVDMPYTVFDGYSKMAHGGASLSGTAN
jgi:hypothetical protein